MTLDRHEIDGLSKPNVRTLPASTFERLMKEAGYEIVGNAPAPQNRIKVWWVHERYRRVESIYSPNKDTVITAYHVT